jgi:CheY-like chemotaxis protein
MLDSTPIPAKFDTLAQKTILVIDDDLVIREGLVQALEHAGALPLQATNGMEALAYLHNASAPDLILLDMMMPLMDGWKFLQNRRAIPALMSIPVVIMTSLGAAGWEWAYSLGATGFVRKPVEVEKLAPTLRHCFCKVTPLATARHLQTTQATR